jgi:hypothetical protein
MQLGRALDDFDVVFGYPWGGEQRAGSGSQQVDRGGWGWSGRLVAVREAGVLSRPGRQGVTGGGAEIFY